jgi:hypothetical protein
MHGECRFTTLACGRGCRVDRCAHGTIHVTLGDVTLRLSEQSFDSIAAVLVRARGEIADLLPAAGVRPC